MAQFSPRSNLRTAKLAVTAAALFGLAGTALSQQQQPAQNPASSTIGKPPAEAAPGPGAAQNQAPAPRSSATNGKVIRQAGAASAAPAKNQPEKAPAADQPAPEGDDKVKVDEHLIVDLHVNDEDLANVLQMLSIQSQKNIVTSKAVSAVVTANLYGVTFYEALDAILHVNGYGYIEKGNFIYVYTLEELVKIEEAQRQRVWKVVKLDYLNSIDAAEFVKPLLSEGGQIKTNGKVPQFQIPENAPTGGEDYAFESTMMIFDFEENLAEIEKVCKELDTRPEQVLVEATILQTSLNEANAFGVDFSLITDLDFSDFVNLGGPLQAVNGLIKGNGASSGSSGSSGGSGGGSGGSGGTSGVPLPTDNKGGSIVSSPGNTSGPGTLKVGLVWNDVAAFVKLLDQVADTSIISRPNILTLNRQPARVLVGRKVGFLNSTTTTTSTTQTVEFLDTGTQLYIRPFISKNHTIRMELKPKVSEAVIRDTTNQGGQTVTIPDEISNELTTNVLVKDGQTIVLGGLFRESTSAARRQVPGLGDLPLIGTAFRGQDDSTERSEIIFMVTPTILADAAASEQGERSLAMIERVRAGGREGLMIWSREKRCQQLVLEATRLAAEGKRDEALSKVQRALSLSHMQPDALQLREELMNEKSKWPTRSMQHEIVRGELEKKLSGSKKAEAALKAEELALREARRNPSRNKPVKAEPVTVEAPGQIVYIPEPETPATEPLVPNTMDPVAPSNNEPGSAEPSNNEPSEPAAGGNEPTEPASGGNEPTEPPSGGGSEPK